MLSFRRLTNDQTRSEVTAPSQPAGDASFHPAVSSGDFDRVVELKKIRQLKTKKIIIFLRIIQLTTNFHLLSAANETGLSNTIGFLSTGAWYIRRDQKEDIVCTYCILFGQAAWVFCPQLHWHTHHATIH